MKDGRTFHEDLADAKSESEFYSKLMLLEKVGLNSNNVAQKGQRNSKAFMYASASTTLRK